MVGYGKLDTSKRLDENEKELIDLSCFDENDPRQHQMKILFGCGIYFGFRGKNEHVFLEIHNFTHGTFPSTHPFSGYEWYGIENIQDKTHKLSIHKDRVRDTKNCMRVPVMDNDPTSSDFGGSIKRFLEKLAPGQTRIYCKAIPEDLRSVDKSGNSKFFYANQPVGKNLISDLFKEGADMLGLPNPKKIAPHCLRSYMVTKIANGKGKYLNFFFVFFLFNF